MTRCADCGGTGEIVAAWWPATSEEPRCPRVTYDCERCEATGWTVEDPTLSDEVDDSPDLEPDGAPLSTLGQVAMLAASLGGPDAVMRAAACLRGDAS